jgi:hypothetical protein
MTDPKGLPQSSKEAGLDRGLLVAQHDYCLMFLLQLQDRGAFGDIAVHILLLGEQAAHSYMRGLFVSFNTECRPRQSPVFVVRRRSAVDTGWLGDNPDTRGCNDFRQGWKRVEGAGVSHKLKSGMHLRLELVRCYYRCLIWKVHVFLTSMRSPKT